MRRRLSIAAALAVGGLIFGGGVAFGAVAPSLDPAEEAAPYIVVFRSGADVDETTSWFERAEGFASRYRFHRALRGFSARLTARQLAWVKANPDVAFVSPDGTVEAVAALASGESAPTGTRRIGAANSTTAQGAASVNVAVIDTGIDLGYTGELDAVSGTNCISPGNAAQDDNGHGTHVSGTIAAKNTGTGVVGVAPGTRLYAVKVLNSAGSGSWSQVICGIDWVTANAAALNIKVASMSLGGSGSNDSNCGSTNGDALHAAICNSVKAGVTYVVAAGNNGANFSGFVPAAYPEVVTVTAVSDSDGAPGGTGGAPTCRTGETDDRYATFSNYAGASDSVAQSHTVAAPGVCITSTWRGGGTNTISGTSMATPHVSGVVALCISGGQCTPGGSPSSIVSAIQTTDPSKGFTGDPLHSPVSGRFYGYIDWIGASAPPPAPSRPGAPALSSATPGNASVTLAWTAPSSDGGSAITGYRIYRGETSGSETPLTTVGNQTSFKDTTVTNGTIYWYRVSAVNVPGEGPLSNGLSATPQAVTAPGAPVNFTAATASFWLRGVQLAWSPPASNGGSAVTGYRVYRSSSPGVIPSSTTLLTTLTGRSYRDSATTRGQTYYYVVTAVNAVGEGPASAQASAKAR